MFENIINKLFNINYFNTYTSQTLIKYVQKYIYICRFNQDWELALEVPVTDLKELKAKVPDLKEKSELQFRILAVNKAGPSPPSESTKLHIVKHKSCKLSLLIFKSKLNTFFFLILVKPRIDRTNLKNVVIRGGKTIKYDVNIKGEPAPTVKWMLVNKEVSMITF